MVHPSTPGLYLRVNSQHPGIPQGYSPPGYTSGLFTTRVIPPGLFSQTRVYTSWFILPNPGISWSLMSNPGISWSLMSNPGINLRYSLRTVLFRYSSLFRVYSRFIKKLRFTWGFTEGLRGRGERRTVNNGEKEGE